MVTRVPRLCANHGIWEHAPVRAKFVDFSIGAIETGATEHTAQSIVKRSGAKEGEVLTRSQDDVRQNAICRDGVNDNNIFSCLLLQKPFNIPSLLSVSPIKTDNLTLQLCCHPDRQKVDYVLNGFRYGFRLGLHPEITTLKSAKANCPFAAQPLSVITEYLAKDVSLGRVFGPTSVSAVDSLQINRFGVIPKKDRGWRLILDLSLPFGHSVNNGINKEELTLTYSKVSYVKALIIKAGRGALMGKVDVRSAYRIIPVHPLDRHLLGMFWQDGYYIDLALPFDLRSAPAIFNSLADLFHWCLVNNWNVLDLLHYLDDYFTLGPPNSDICASRRRAIDRAANEIGIPLSPDKCVGPTTCLVFLGIQLDSVHMTAKLPPDKRIELIELLDEWAIKCTCRQKELQTFVGKLSHACAVVPQGRNFVRRLLDLQKGHSSKQSRFIRLNQECKRDIEWWRSFLPSWDGVYFFDLPDWAPVPGLFLSTDASRSLGYGAFYADEWFDGSWSATQRSLSISYKELCHIVIACHVWGSQWRYHHIQFCCDNQSVVAVISSGTSKDSRLMQFAEGALSMCGSV